MNFFEIENDLKSTYNAYFYDLIVFTNNNKYLDQHFILEVGFNIKQITNLVNSMIK